MRARWLGASATSPHCTSGWSHGQTTKSASASAARRAGTARAWLIAPTAFVFSTPAAGLVARAWPGRSAWATSGAPAGGGVASGTTCCTCGYYSRTHAGDNQCLTSPSHDGGAWSRLAGTVCREPPPGLPAGHTGDVCARLAGTGTAGGGRLAKRVESERKPGGRVVAPPGWPLAGRAGTGAARDGSGVAALDRPTPQPVLGRGEMGRRRQEPHAAPLSAGLDGGARCVVSALAARSLHGLRLPGVQLLRAGLLLPGPRLAGSVSVRSVGWLSRRRRSGGYDWRGRGLCAGRHALAASDRYRGGRRGALWPVRFSDQPLPARRHPGGAGARAAAMAPAGDVAAVDGPGNAPGAALARRHGAHRCWGAAGP